jgi:acetyl esterase/lipase
MNLKHILSAFVLLLAGAQEIHPGLHAPAGYAVDTDIRYGNVSESQCLDLMYPSPADSPQPAIVLIHSGGWYTGDKGGPNTFRMMCSFAEAGYVAVSIGYRLADEAPFPAAVEDCKLAVRWLRANSERYGIDPSRIAAMGASAGGHLAAMLAVTKPEDNLEGRGALPEISSAVQAAVAVAAPFDLRIPLSSKFSETDDPAVVRFLGGPLAEKNEEARRASPIAYIRGVTTPLMIVHGAADKRVCMNQAEAMARALEQAGSPHQVIIVEDGGHGMGIAREEKSLQRILVFLGVYLGKADPTDELSP